MHTKQLRIYFAGSIRGGRDDKELYLKLIEYLGAYGNVLTEHIGDKELTHIGEDGPNDVWIYDRDMSWLADADVVVAEVSMPSLGVGYEIGKAEDMKKPILCLWRIQENKRLSAMLAGSPHPKICRYTDYDDAKKYIDEFFVSLGAKR